jgi:hypothetical protein
VKFIRDMRRQVVGWKLKRLWRVKAFDTCLSIGRFADREEDLAESVVGAVDGLKWDEYGYGERSEVCFLSKHLDVLQCSI